MYPIDWLNVDLKYISPNPCIIDFGESFEASHPPKDLGIPGPYRAPELMLDHKTGYGSDLCALGCTIFETRTGRKLFDAFDDEDDVYLDEMVRVLGVMPEPWWSTTWHFRKQVFEDHADDSGKAILIRSHEKEEPRRDNVTVHPSVAEGSRSLLDKLAPGVWYLDSDVPYAECHREIIQREKELLADLLGSLLKFDPEGRLSAEEVLKHEWLRCAERSY